MDNNIKTPNFSSIVSSKKTLHSFEENLKETEKVEKADPISTLNRLFSQTKPIESFDNNQTEVLIDEDIPSMDNKERTADLELKPQPIFPRQTNSFSPPPLVQPPLISTLDSSIEPNVPVPESLKLDSWDEEDRINLDTGEQIEYNPIEEEFIINPAEELNTSVQPLLIENEELEATDPTIEWHKDSERLFKEQNQDFYRFPGFPIKDFFSLDSKKQIDHEETLYAKERNESNLESTSNVHSDSIEEKTDLEKEAQNDSWSNEELEPTIIEEFEESDDDYQVPNVNQNNENENDPTLLWKEEQEQILLNSIQDFNDPTNTLTETENSNNEDSDLVNENHIELENEVSSDTSSGWDDEDQGENIYADFEKNQDNDYQDDFISPYETIEENNSFDEIDPTVNWQQEQEELVQESENVANDFDPTDRATDVQPSNQQNTTKVDDMNNIVVPLAGFGAGAISGAVLGSVVNSGVNPFLLDHNETQEELEAVAGSEAEAEAVTDVEAEAEAEAEADVEAEAETVTDVEAEAEADVEVEAEADVEAEAEAEAETVTDVEAEAEAVTDVAAVTGAETEVEAVTDVEEEQKIIDLTQNNEDRYFSDSENTLFSLNFTSKNDFNIQEEKTNNSLVNTETKLFQPIIQDPKTIIKNASKRWNMNVPRSLEDKRKNPLYNDILSNIQRKLMPNDVKLSNIESFTRYKGTPISIAFNQFNTDGKYTLFGLVDNPMRVEVRISKDTKNVHSIYKHLVLEEEFSELFQLYIQNQFDLEWTNKILDIFIQKNLVEVSPFLHENDEIIINRSGVFIKIRNLRNEDELEQTLSALFMLCDNLKKMNK